MRKIVIELTQRQAEQLGVVRCQCGHPSNNHFDFETKPCAHCKCQGYRQVMCLPKG